MATRSQTQFGGSASNIYTLVGCYSALVFIVAIIGDLLAAGGANLPWKLIIDAIICVAVGAVGMLLAFIEELWAPGGRPPGSGFPPPPPTPPWLFHAFLLTVCVIVIIGGAFYYAHTHKQPNNPNYFIATGVASALAWGLSVVGALIWSGLGIVSHPYWNSWFNLFAAAFAGLAVGYT
jgi:hypothetical protein